MNDPGSLCKGRHAVLMWVVTQSLFESSRGRNTVVIELVVNAVLIWVVTQRDEPRNCCERNIGYVPVLECLVTGPHIRTVPSSLADANIVGSLEFQLTQFTILV